MENNQEKNNDSVLNKIDALSDEQKYNLLCELLKTRPAHYNELIEYLLLSINDNSFLLDSLSVIPSLIPNKTIIKVFKKINNDSDRLEGISRFFTNDNRLPLLKYVLLTFDSDINKQAFFYLLKDEEKVEIIKTFKNDYEKIKYIEDKDFKSYKAELIASLNNYKIIVDYFNKSKDIDFNLEIIKQIKDPDLKLIFIGSLGFDDLTYFWVVSRNNENCEEENFEKDNVDSNISIGIELEVCHKFINIFKIEEHIFDDYTITDDESLKNGFEIKSPILHYTNKDLSKLKRICYVLNSSHFYTDNSCGGHIHIGADYLNNIENYKTLLYIYCNCENIFYLISNKSNTRLRKTSKYFANKIKSIYIKSLNKGLLSEDKCSFEDFLKILVRINGKRDKGMNLRNLGDVYKNTIEFRIPNGEIDFNELRNNIKLFAKLVERSKELSTDKISDKDKSLLTALNIPCTDDEKLEILLGLLFDNEEEKNIYRERYESNKNTKQRIMSKHYKDKKILNFN